MGYAGPDDQSLCGQCRGGLGAAGAGHPTLFNRMADMDGRPRSAQTWLPVADAAVQAAVRGRKIKRTARP